MTATNTNIVAYQPLGVDAYRNFIRTESLIGYLPNMDAAAVHSFYSNLAYAFQFLEYIICEFGPNCPKRAALHTTVITHYTKTFYGVSFSIIEAILKARLKKLGLMPTNRRGREIDKAQVIIQTALAHNLISTTLATELDALRDKRNKIHLSKVLENTGTSAFNEHDWNSFNRDDLNNSRKGLYDLILNVSGLTDNAPEIQRLFSWLKP